MAKRTDEVIAKRSNYNQEYSTSLFSACETLYRTADGRYYLASKVGAALRANGRRLLTRGEAVEWVAAQALDPITGYGFSQEQAERMVDGIEAGPGRRDW